MPALDRQVLERRVLDSQVIEVAGLVASEEHRDILKKWDDNDLHFIDPSKYGYRFTGPIAHGVLPVSSMADAISLIHKDDTIGIRELSLEFIAPVYYGNKIVPVVTSSSENGLSHLDINCIKFKEGDGVKGETVVKGKFSVGAPEKVDLPDFYSFYKRHLLKIFSTNTSKKLSIDELLSYNVHVWKKIIGGTQLMTFNQFNFGDLESFIKRYFSQKTNNGQLLMPGDYSIKEVVVDEQRVKADSQALTKPGKGMEMILPLVLISGALGDRDGTLYVRQSGSSYITDLSGRNAVELLVKGVNEKRATVEFTLETNVYRFLPFATLPFFGFSPYGPPLPVFKGEAVVRVPKQVITGQSQYK